jgi:hypothetical protein
MSALSPVFFLQRISQLFIDSEASTPTSTLAPTPTSTGTSSSPASTSSAATATTTAELDNDVFHLKVLQVLAALLHNLSARLAVDGAEVVANQTFAPLELSSVEGHFCPVNSSVLCIFTAHETPRNVGVSVVATIHQTPGAEPTATSPTSQCETPIEVNESLAAALKRALQRQELLAKVLAALVNVPLLRVHSSEPPLLFLEPVLLLFADLLGQPDLEKLPLRVQVSQEGRVSRMPDDVVRADGGLVFFVAKPAHYLPVPRLEFPQVVCRRRRDLKSEAIVAQVVAVAVARAHVTVNFPQGITTHLAFAKALSKPCLGALVALCRGLLVLKLALLGCGQAAEAITLHSSSVDGCFFGRDELRLLRPPLRLDGHRLAFDPPPLGSLLLLHPGDLFRTSSARQAELLLGGAKKLGSLGQLCILLRLHLQKVCLAVALNLIELLLGLPRPVGKLGFELTLKARDVLRSLFVHSLNLIFDLTS